MKALIVVDVQNDFMPGGALPVTDGDKIVPVINGIRDQFDTVVFTQDWHPAGHCSFKGNDCALNKAPGIWPVHCVQGTPGAELHKDLVVEEWDLRIRKGTFTSVDSYSGFFDNERVEATDLHDKLQDLGVTELFICGLATDYCVKFTAIDAAEFKILKGPAYNVTVLLNACRGVNVSPKDVEDAVRSMRHAGVKVSSTLDFS